MSLDSLRFSRRNLIVSVLLLVLAAVGTGVLLSGGSSSASAESSLAGYGALTSDKPVAATAADVRPALDRIARSHPEVLGGTARIIGSTETGRIAIFSAGNGDICLALASPSGSGQTACDSPLRSNFSGVAFGGPVNRFGVVPDGVDSVRFLLKSGSEETVKVVGNFYVAPDEAVKGIFEHNGSQQTREFVARSTAPAIGQSVTDARGATMRVEPDGTTSLAGPGVKMPNGATQHR